MSGMRHLFAEPAVRRSTTQPVLRRLLTSLLLVTVVLLGTTLWAFHRVHGAAESVRTRTAPAILELTVAREALVKADSAAIRSFFTGEVLLAGPGHTYRNQFASARQSLNRVAENNAAGEAGSQTMQLVEELLVVYTELISQADVHHRQGDNTALGIADLWHATRQLHGDNGILHELGVLESLQWRAFDDQLAGSSTTPLVVLVAAGPTALLLVLLGITQQVLRRRFRRIVNPLLLATLALVGLSVFTWLVFSARDQLADSRSALERVVDDSSARITLITATGQGTMRQHIEKLCDQPPTGCGATVTRFADRFTQRVPAVTPVDDSQLADGTRTVTEQTAAAQGRAGPESMIYVLSALIALTVLFGLIPRIDEYRYRPT